MKWFDLEDESIVPSGPVFIYATDKARDDALRNDIGGYHATIPPTALAAIHDTRICMIDLPSYCFACVMHKRSPAGTHNHRAHHET